MRIGAKATALLEGVGIAIEALRANRARAALTILGVAIGVFVVVVMSAAIHGITAGVQQEFESAGPTTFTLNRFPIVFGPCDTCKWRYNPPIAMSELDAISRLPSIRAVVPRNGVGNSVRYRDHELRQASISAFGARWPEVGGGDLYSGRNFTPAEDMAGARVIIINDKMAARLFNEGDPLGKTIAVGTQPFEVIGLYRDPAELFGSGETPRAIVPYSTALRHLGVRSEWMQVTIKPAASVSRDLAIDDVTALMRGVRRLRPAAESNFAIITQDQLYDSFQKVTSGFFLVMITLSGIGLIVGGVGVVAIMMISVTERTREIGVRKAMGATRGIILWQFLIEAATVTAIGAVVGLAIGWLVSYIIRHATPVPTSIPPGAIVAALGASVMTGVFFGLYPAIKAAKLDPIDALRYE